ncbi:enoyl-ACP reductase FabI [Hwanghaeella sp.]|uniref:enoyl-ACP reductase FabI n=1 Tax=Hwanghaeella sp. TaxID=2605943 RepID=UPI003CCC2F89
MDMPVGLLAGKTGLVVGIANEQSIAAGCATAFRAAGANLAVTYLNDKARPHVEPVSKAVGADLFMPLDVEQDDQMETLFKAIEEHWGRLDFVLHSIAFSPKEDLHGRVIDSSRQGFARAMDVSVHSFVRMARLAEPLMKQGGCLLTVSYYGAEKVVDNYNIMGPVKSALESTMRYMAAELGPSGIRVNALSPGPIETRAASGIANFDSLMERAKSRSPERKLATIEDVGALATCLVSDYARSVTGNVAYVDAGYHVMS